MSDDVTIPFPEWTKAGWKEAREGDGLVMMRPHHARGTVQEQKCLTVMTGIGGGCGVVTNDDRQEHQAHDGKLRIRYLTPRECWRLMGQPDWAYDRAVDIGTPKTHLYKQAGNSIVVDVLEAIFRGMYVDGTWEDSKPKSRRVTLDDFGGDS